MDPLLIDHEQACQVLKMSPRTLRRHVQEGTIPSLKVGTLRRYSVEALRDWINRNQTQVTNGQHQ